MTTTSNATVDRRVSSASSGSSRFRESVHLIPTPGIEAKRPPRYEPLIIKFWVVSLIAGTLIGLAVALEVALSISEKNHGFKVPSKNVFSFASTAFLSSFFPTLLVIPLALLWNATDWFIRWYHPYVTLSRGNATASESLLLDYIALNKLLVIVNSFRRRHTLIFVSSMTVLLSFLLQPLAGAVFSIQQVPRTIDSSVSSIRKIGLSPDISDLNSFVAAAGFVAAAVAHDLPDPPFIEGGWSAAEFIFPTDAVLNGSMAVNTTGIQSSANCENPANISLQTPPGSDNYTIVATSTEGCSSNVTFNPSTSDQQYGVTNVPGCGLNTQNVSQQTVMFWFFHLRQDGTPQAAGVFCEPKIEVFNIIATANLNNGSLVNVTILNPYTPYNNVTDEPLGGQAFNGVIFDQAPNAFIQARAVATRSGVPGAVFRFASLQEEGPQSTFDDPNGFLRRTRQVYTQHLAISAQSNYFVSDDTVLPAKMTSLVPRLVIEPLAAHGLALTMVLIGITGIVVHFAHKRARRELYLTAPPGSIAAIVSLTSRSGFGDLLVPYDDERSMKQKLGGLRFRLDRRTGAILAEDDGLGGEEAMMTLLDQQRQSIVDPYQPQLLKSPYES